MPFKETGSQKEKREAYYKDNKERGLRAEKQKEYEIFGTTEQNIPAVDTMGNVTGMKKGGKVRHYKSAVNAVKAAEKRGDKSITVNFSKGGSASKRADGCAIRGKTRA